MHITANEGGTPAVVAASLCAEVTGGFSAEASTVLDTRIVKRSVLILKLLSSEKELVKSAHEERRGEVRGENEKSENE